MPKPKNFLVIVDEVADTQTEIFDQIIEALTDQGISAEVHELDDDDVMIGGIN